MWKTLVIKFWDLIYMQKNKKKDLRSDFDPIFWPLLVLWIEKFKMQKLFFVVEFNYVNFFLFWTPLHYNIFFKFSYNFVVWDLKLLFNNYFRILNYPFICFIKWLKPIFFLKFINNLLCFTRTQQVCCNLGKFFNGNSWRYL